MSTVIRPELSDKNPNYISRHRYYELKHFCLQYPEWAKSLSYLNQLDGFQKSNLKEIKSGNSYNNMIADLVTSRVYLERRMNLVKEAAENASDEICDYIFKAVTEGKSFDYLKTMLDIPCGKDFYYTRYRRFFWILSKQRQ